MTLRELGALHGCTHSEIARWAKKEGWTRDLSDAVRKATSAKLIEAAVADAVAEGATTAQQGATNAVLVAAEIATKVIRTHQRDATKARELAAKMMSELLLATEQTDDIEAVFERVTEDAGELEMQRAREKLNGLLALPNRVKTLKDLTEALSKVEALETRAYKLATDAPPPPPAPPDLTTIPPEQRQDAYLRYVSGLR